MDNSLTFASGEPTSPEVLDRANRNLGELIWRLEAADAPPGTVVGHSADAVPPLTTH